MPCKRLKAKLVQLGDAIKEKLSKFAGQKPAWIFAVGNKKQHESKPLLLQRASHRRIVPAAFPWQYHIDANHHPGPGPGAIGRPQWGRAAVHLAHSLVLGCADRPCMLVEKNGENPPSQYFALGACSAHFGQRALVGRLGRFVHDLQFDKIIERQGGLGNGAGKELTALIYGMSNCAVPKPLFSLGQ